MDLDGSPGTGTLFWAAVTLPPKTVAHEERERIKAKETIVVIVNFSSICLNFFKP